MRNETKYEIQFIITYKIIGSGVDKKKINVIYLWVK